MTEPLAELLRLGKYTHWMVELTDDQVAGLLWLVGEFAVRSAAVPLTDPADLLVQRLRPSFPIRHVRQLAALNAIAEFRRKPKTLEEVRTYIRECMHDAEAQP